MPEREVRLTIEQWAMVVEELKMRLDYGHPYDRNELIAIIRSIRQQQPAAIYRGHKYERPS